MLRNLPKHEGIYGKRRNNGRLRLYRQLGAKIRASRRGTAMVNILFVPVKPGAVAVVAVVVIAIAASTLRCLYFSISRPRERTPPVLLQRHEERNGANPLSSSTFSYARECLASTH